MKKFLVSLLAIALSLVFFTASGCAPSVPLAFNNDFNGGGGSSAEPTSLTETLFYEVKYTDNYSDTIVKDENITDDVIKFRFENGSYTQTLSVDGFIDESIQTDLDVQSNRIYHLTTEFAIDLVYDLNDGNGEQTYSDSIITTAHFLSASNSFAPIYSNVKVTQSYIFLPTSAEGTAKVEQNTYEYTTVYSTDEYVIETKDSEGQTTSKTFDYDYKKVIDNTQLLFALRNVGLAPEKTCYLPTVSPSYGEAKTIKATGQEESTVQTNGLTFNGSPVDAQSVKVNNLSYLIDSNTNTGAFQYVKIQREKAGNLPFKSLMMEYVEGLPSYGSFTTLGALVYTLKSVTIA